MITALYVKDKHTFFKILPVFLGFGIHIEGFPSLVSLEIETNWLHLVLAIITFKKLVQNLEHTLKLNVVYVHFCGRKPVF